MKPKALDLFCSAGGATRGLQLAGFHVTGVDIAPQPRYVGDAFHQADAMTFPLDGFDFVWASPPCQAYTSMSNRYRGQGGVADQHGALIHDVRSRLLAAGVPYVIENVPGAKRDLRHVLKLHGGMFGLRVSRLRLFETSILILGPHGVPVANPVGVYGVRHDGRRLWSRADGTEQRAARSLVEAREAMGIDWMEWRELAESIPPAFSKYIGDQMLPHVLRAMKARAVA